MKIKVEKNEDGPVFNNDRQNVRSGGSRARQNANGNSAPSTSSAGSGTSNLPVKVKQEPKEELQDYGCDGGVSGERKWYCRVPLALHTPVVEQWRVSPPIIHAFAERSCSPRAGPSSQPSHSQETNTPIHCSRSPKINISVRQSQSCERPHGVTPTSSQSWASSQQMQRDVHCQQMVQQRSAKPPTIHTFSRPLCSPKAGPPTQPSCSSGINISYWQLQSCETQQVVNPTSSQTYASSQQMQQSAYCPPTQRIQCVELTSASRDSSRADNQAWQPRPAYPWIGPYNPTYYSYSFQWQQGVYQNPACERQMMYPYQDVSSSRAPPYPVGPNNRPYHRRYGAPGQRALGRASRSMPPVKKTQTSKLQGKQGVAKPGPSGGATAAKEMAPKIMAPSTSSSRGYTVLAQQAQSQESRGDSSGEMEQETKFEGKKGVAEPGPNRGSVAGKENVSEEPRLKKMQSSVSPLRRNTAPVQQALIQASESQSPGEKRMKNEVPCMKEVAEPGLIGAAAAAREDVAEKTSPRKCMSPSKRIIAPAEHAASQASQCWSPGKKRQRHESQVNKKVDKAGHSGSMVLAGKDDCEASFPKKMRPSPTPSEKNSSAAQQSPKQQTSQKKSARKRRRRAKMKANKGVAEPGPGGSMAVAGRGDDEDPCSKKMRPSPTPSKKNKAPVQHSPKQTSQKKSPGKKKQRAESQANKEVAKPEPSRTTAAADNDDGEDPYRKRLKPCTTFSKKNKAPVQQSPRQKSQKMSPGKRKQKTELQATEEVARPGPSGAMAAAGKDDGEDPYPKKVESSPVLSKRNKMRVQQSPKETSQKMSPGEKRQKDELEVKKVAKSEPSGSIAVAGRDDGKGTCPKKTKQSPTPSKKNKVPAPSPRQTSQNNCGKMSQSTETQVKKEVSKLGISGDATADEGNADPCPKKMKPPAVPSQPLSSRHVRQRALDKLRAAQFRLLNEEMYLTSGNDAEQAFKEDPQAFKYYHAGFQKQVAKWPVNPVDIIIKGLRKLPKKTVIADMGCGNAKLAQSLRGWEVHSFDLVALNNDVTECDMSNVPLDSSSVDVVVFCLSLMGTNLNSFILEANRILKTGGTLKVAEVESRFSNIKSFIEELKKFGFTLVNKNGSHKMFILFEFKKAQAVKEHPGLPKLQLKPCLYKKR